MNKLQIFVFIAFLESVPTVMEMAFVVQELYSQRLKVNPNLLI